MKLIYFFLIVFFGAFAYFVVKLTNEQINDIRTHATSENMIEAESGVLSSGAEVASDTSASSGSFVLLNTGTTPLPTLQPGTWQEVGTHPQAVNMATAMGKVLITLEPWNGKLYAGYGDFDQNLGPTWITSFDPNTYTFTTHAQSATDAIWNYRPLRSQLFAPSTDSIGAIDFAAGDSSNAWTDNDFGGTTHVFDANTLTGSDLWMTGSLSYDAVAWRSLDGGVSWSQAQKSTSTGGVERYYFAGVYNGKLYLQSNVDAGKSKVFDGTTWTTGPGLGGHWWRPIEFAGKMAALTNYPAYSTSSLSVFNGSKVTTPQTLLYNYATEGNTMYVLHTNGQIQKSTDLSTWSTVTTAPTGTRSIAVLNGMLYAGTADAKLFVYGTPMSTLPSVTITALDNSASEKGDSGSVLIKRSGSTTTPLTVTLRTSGTATSGTDYQAVPTSVTIPAGQSETTLPITPISDGTSDNTEAVILDVTPQSPYNISSPSEALITIYESSAVSITATTYHLKEGQSGLFTLRRNGDLTRSLPVSLSIQGNAINGADYTTLSSSVTIPAGSSSVTIPVQVIQDTVEEETKTLTLQVNNSTSYTRVLPVKDTIQIEDDDASPNPNLIKNPSFETGTTTADTWGIGSSNWDKTVAHSGTASFKKTGPSTYSYIQQGVALIPGKTYIISMYVKTQNAYGLGGAFRMVQTAGSSDIREATWTNDTHDWRKVSMRYTAKADYTAGRLDLTFKLSGGDTVWFDDIAIREAP